MNNTHLIISEVRKQTDEVILFHSLTGKDSIVLLELLSSRFTKVLCCFMYVVNDLEITTKYKKFIEAKYSNVELISVPSYEVYSIIKNGAYGVQKDPKQKLYTLADITSIVKKKHGIEWAIFGTKMNEANAVIKEAEKQIAKETEEERQAKIDKIKEVKEAQKQPSNFIKHFVVTFNSVEEKIYFLEQLGLDAEREFIQGEELGKLIFE